MGIQKEKILKMSKILDALLKMGAILLVMIGAGAMVAIVMAPSLDTSSLSLKGMWGELPLNVDLNGFRAAMVPEVLSAGMLASIFFIASFIFKDMKLENTPFTKKTADRLRVISLLIIAVSIIVPSVRLLLLMVYIPSADFYMEINLVQLIFAALFFCLALIFEYGAQLQRESDETL